ncbi:MAG: T9SS type A sorting domain-containing protein [Bacteroidales bacterium]|jgi:hypothetical protein|nr:T9SS type A sorting domain-containing protein [Bacteroidales bacterium]
MKIRKVFLITVLTLSSLSLMAQNSDWVKLGPENIGGRVRSVVFDKYNSDVMYAGGVAGGFYISVNNGKNWEEIQLGEGENASTAVTAICQTEDGTVYVGTGESYYNSTSPIQGVNNAVNGQLGNGVYKLDNWSNANWTASLATDSAKYAYAKSNMHFVSLANTRPVKYDRTDEWTYVNNMASLGNTIFVGLTKNLKYSNDGGATWNNVTITGASAGSIFVSDIKVNKNGRIAVAYGISGSTIGGANVSDYKIAINNPDDVTTYTNILTKNNIGISPTPTSLGRIVISFGINDPNTLYAAVGAEAGSNLDGVFRTRSLDNVAWTRAMAASQAYYYYANSLDEGLSLFVDDRGEYEKVYMGAKLRTSSAISYLLMGYDNNNTGGTGLYLWKTEAYSNAYISDSNWVADNIHSILMKENPQTKADSLMMVLTTDGGVFIYREVSPYVPALPEFAWQLSIKGMNTVQFYDVAVSADGSVFGAAQSNAIVYIPKASKSIFVNTDDEIIWNQINDTTIIVDGSQYFYFTSTNYTVNVEGNTLTINYKTNVNGDMIWSPNSIGYYDNVLYDYEYSNYGWDFSGSSVVASGFEKISPSYVKPAILARPYTTLTRTYSNNNSYYDVNTTTWNFKVGDLQLLPQYLAPDDSDPINAPMCLWESINATSVPDSTKMVIDINTIINGRIGGTSSGDEWKYGAWILPGDSVLVKSSTHPLNYPFYHTLTDSIQLQDSTLGPMSITVQDPVQSRLFFASVKAVYACNDILDFSKYVIASVGQTDYSNDLVWANIFPVPTGSKVHCLSASADGNTLFVALEEGAASTLVRITGLLAAHLTDHELVTGTFYNSPGMNMPNPLTIDTILSVTRIITSIATDRNNNNNLIITFGDFKNSASVMRSTNAMAAGASVSFTDITGIDPNTTDNIPAIKPVFTALIESMKNTNGHIAYIGAEDGVWKTNDFTANPVEWEKMEGVPNVPVYKLVQQTNNQPFRSYVEYEANTPTWNMYCATEAPGAIYAATYGKGLYAYFGDTVAQLDSVVSIDDINRYVAENSSVKLDIYPNPAQKETSINYYLPTDTKVSFKLYDLNGRLISTMERGSHRAGHYTMQMNCRNLNKGIYMVQILTRNGVSTAKLIVQ